MSRTYEIAITESVACSSELLTLGINNQFAIATHATAGQSKDVVVVIDELSNAEFTGAAQQLFSMLDAEEDGDPRTR